MDFEKLLQETVNQAEKHYQMWQQDIGAINILRGLIEESKKEKPVEIKQV